MVLLKIFSKVFDASNAARAGRRVDLLFKKQKGEPPKTDEKDNVRHSVKARSAPYLSGDSQSPLSISPSVADESKSLTEVWTTVLGSRHKDNFLDSYGQAVLVTGPGLEKTDPAHGRTARERGGTQGVITSQQSPSPSKRAASGISELKRGKPGVRETQRQHPDRAEPEIFQSARSQARCAGQREANWARPGVGLSTPGTASGCRLSEAELYG